jgi:hypothetical protein
MFLYQGNFFWFKAMNQASFAHQAHAEAGLMLSACPLAKFADRESEPGKQFKVARVDSRFHASVSSGNSPRRVREMLKNVAFRFTHQRHTS